MSLIERTVLVSGIPARVDVSTLACAWAVAHKVLQQNAKASGNAGKRTNPDMMVSFMCAGCFHGSRHKPFDGLLHGFFSLLCDVCHTTHSATHRSLQRPSDRYSAQQS